MIRSGFFFFLFIILASFGCSDDTVVIPDNAPPPDGTISLLYRENFVKKTYLGLLGKLPTDAQLATSMVALDVDNCSEQNRSDLVSSLMTMPDYKYFQFYTDFNELLDYPSTWDFQWYHTYILDKINDPNAADELAYWQQNLALMDTLTGLWDKYSSGQYDLRDCHARMVNNLMYFYTIGSKSEWPVATFSYFLLRQPTMQEGYDCNDMISGLSIALFLQEGNSMNDLLYIFFNSTEYSEGQIRILFYRYLNREPTGQELVKYLDIFGENKDLSAVQRAILLTDEFIKN